MEENIKTSGLNINYSEAAKHCPDEKKHLENCQKAVAYIISNKALCDETVKIETLPSALISAGTGIDRNFIEEHRKYIMAMVILRSAGFEPNLCDNEYLVMECNADSAVLFDCEERFIKAVNKGYSVGETVSDIVSIKKSRFSEFFSGRRRDVLELIIFVICFCVMFFASWYFLFTPAGTVRIGTVPDVLLSFNKAGIVTEAVGLNEEGEMILEGFDRGFKSVKRATVDMLRRMRDYGFTEEGDTVEVTVESNDSKWAEKTEDTIKEIVLSRKLEYVKISE